MDGLAPKGGGIHNDGGNLLLINCEIKDSRAYGFGGEGGGIFNSGPARLSMFDCKVHDNAAENSGGGISNSGIDSSLLTLGPEGSETAAETLSTFFSGLQSMEPPTSTNPEEATAEIEAGIKDLMGDFLDSAGTEEGGVQPLFESLGDDPFAAGEGWSGGGMPSAVIEGCQIYNNRVGKGAAGSATLLRGVPVPVVVGQDCSPLGCIPILGGIRLTDLSPADFRFAGFGGGIHNDLGLVSIKDCTITDNEVDTHLGSSGGGLSSFLGAVKVVNSKLNSNRAYSTTVLANGGGVHSFASLMSLEDCEVDANTAKVGVILSSGAGLKSTGVSFVSLTRSSVSGNEVGGEGGGIANDYLATLHLDGVSVEDNTAEGFSVAGGGIRNNNGGVAQIENSTISGNSVTGNARGGGVYNQCTPFVSDPEHPEITRFESSRVTLRNSTISNNLAIGLAFDFEVPVYGAGIYNASDNLGVAELNIYSCTVFQNRVSEGLNGARNGGGLYNTGVAIKPGGVIPPGEAIVNSANNFFAANFAPGLVEDFETDPPSNVENVFAVMNRFGDDLTIEINPGLAPLAFNGGPTRTHALLPGSPALDAGDPDLNLGEEKSPSSDQRGADRRLAGLRDIGASESIPPIGSSEEYELLEDTVLAIEAPGVLLNDFGDSQVAQIVSDPSNGSVDLLPDGSFRYTPALDFIGTDSFVYRGVDLFGREGESTTVTLRVNPKLELAATIPAVNDSLISSSRVIRLTFDEAVSAEGVAANLVLVGSMNGPLSFVVTSLDTQNLEVTVDRDFSPGESVRLTLMGDLRSVAGSPWESALTLAFYVSPDKSDGTFVFGGPLTGTQVGDRVFVDVDGDGDVDVVGENAENSLWLNESGLTPVSSGQILGALRSWGAAVMGEAVATGDLNGDGFTDVVIVNNASGVQGSIWLNDGAGLFARDGVASSQIGDRATDVAVGDLNNDGHLDLFMTTSLSSTNGSRVHLNDGSGGFEEVVLVGVDPEQIDTVGDRFNSSAVALADFNGDGQLDAYIANSGEGEADQVFLNDGFGYFTFNGQALGTAAGTAVAVGDVNGDGFVDAVVANSGGDAQVWINDGTGQFALGASLADDSQGVVVVDVDADGDLDLVTDNQLWGNDGGNGTFVPVLAVGDGSAVVSAGDIENDGDIDLLFASGEAWLNVTIPVTQDHAFTVVEDETLTITTANGLFVSSSELNGYAASAQLVIAEHRGTYTELRSQFPELDFFAGLGYEGSYPNGNFVYRETLTTQYGTLAVNPDGSFVYTPEADFFGTDSFTYIIYDGPVPSSESVVTINVTPTLDPPIGKADVYNYLFTNGTGQVFTDRSAEFGVLANDSDPDGGSLTATLLTQPANGTVTMAPDGSFVFYASAGFENVDEFTYAVSNSLSTTGPILVQLGKFPIEGVTDYYAVVPGEGITIPAGEGVLSNDSNPNTGFYAGSITRAYVSSGPSHGSLSFSSDGSFTYTPDVDYLGTDSFTYRVASALGSIIIESAGPFRVKLGNTPPVAVDDLGPYLVFPGAPLVVNAAEGVIPNDSDPDGDPNLSATLVSGPANGSIDLDPDGGFTYSPTSGFSGDDSFTYTASDGVADSNVATVSLQSVDRLRVLSISPEQNDTNAAANSNIQLVFSANLDADSLEGSLTIHGSQSGLHPFSLNVSDATITLNPTVDFFPGEIVTVSAAAGIQNSGNLLLQTGYVTQFQVEVLRGGANFVRVEPSAAPPGGSDVALGDLDGDGLPDALIVQRYKFPIVMINNGDRTFTEHTETLGFDSAAGPINPQKSILADFDGDGSLDTFYQGQVEGEYATAVRFHVAINNGSGRFTDIKTIPYELLDFVDAGDFDGDGDIDLLGVNAPEAWIWRNDGSANFTYDPLTRVRFGSRSFAGDSAVGDLDNDGDLDVYVTNSNGGALLINDGTGQFTGVTSGVDLGRGENLALGDFNEDGFLDASVVKNYSNGWQRNWFNDGTGQFLRGAQALKPAEAIEILGLAVGDLNGDGSLDLWQGIYINSSERSGGNAVWFNQGDGRMDIQQPIFGSSIGKAASLADLDQDGDLDVFVLSSVAEVWFNESPPRARDDYYTGSARSDSAPGVLTNDSTGDGVGLTAEIHSAPGHGSVTLNPDGSFTYTPDGTFAGADVFTYVAKDSLAESGIARVKIGNTAPSALDDQFAVQLDEVLEVLAPGVTSNDTDPEGDPLFAVLVSSTAFGLLELNDDGSFVYTPNSGYTGPDSFSYRVSDGLTESATTTIVSINVGTELQVLATTPAANSTTMGLSDQLTIRFNGPIDPATIAGNVSLVGDEQGEFSFTTTNSDQTLTLIPDDSFFPGEGITLTLSSGLRGALDESFLQPLVFQFVVEAPTGEGVFTDSLQRLGDGIERSAPAAFGDFNDDGHVDVLITKFAKIMNGALEPSISRIWFNDGLGMFTDSGQEISGRDSGGPPIDSNPGRPSLGDVDSDGDLDFVLRNGEIWLNDGNGVFRVSDSLMPEVSRSIEARLIDLDGDGDLDYVNVLSAGMAIAINDGAGIFTNDPTKVADLDFVGVLFKGATFGDVNGDNTIDIVVRIDQSAFRVWLNDGTGSFHDSNAAFGNGRLSGPLELGDLDGDGDLDLFAASYVGIFATVGEGFVFFNDGNGFFTDSGQIYPDILRFRDLELADFDGDGDLDALVNQWGTEDESAILENDGSGIFTKTTTVFGDFGPSGSGGANFRSDIVVADVNGDAALDLLILALNEPDQIWVNGSVLAPVVSLPNLTVSDKDSPQPFGTNLIRGGGTNAVSLSVTIDDPAVGDFTAASLSSAGFTGPAAGPYTSSAPSGALAQAALRMLVFDSVENRVSPGVAEVVTLTIEATAGTVTRTSDMTMTIISTNDAPSGGADGGVGFTTSKGVPFTTGDVLVNDTDLDPLDILTIVDVNPSRALGELTHLGNGTFSYDPSNSFVALPVGLSATDLFIYTLEDAYGAQTTAEVAITITGSNTLPLAMNDALSIDESPSALVIVNSMLANDQDADTGDRVGLIVNSVDGTGTSGTVQRHVDGSVTYLTGINLAPGVIANDTFQYTVIDVHGGVSAPAEVTLVITGQADAPVAVADSLSVDENADAVDITALVLGNDTDPDLGQAATLVISATDSTLTKGRVLVSGGTLTYDPDFQFDSLPVGSSTTDSLDYIITDVDGLTSRASVTVTINGANDAPFVVRDFPSVVERSAAVDLTDMLLANDIDQDTGEATQLKIVSIDDTGASGSVTFSAGRVTYAPGSSVNVNLGQIGTDTFLYTIEDPHGLTEQGQVTVSITYSNDPPVIISDGGGVTASVSVPENQTAVTTVTATDSDIPAQTLTFSITGGADKAQFDIDSTTGELTFFSAPDFESAADAGTDNIYNVQVTVTDDGEGNLAVAQDIAVTVININESPQFTLVDLNPSETEDSVASPSLATINNFAVEIQPGPNLAVNESGQALIFNVTVLNTTGDVTFEVAPTINPNTGDLTFRTAPNTNGAATIHVTLSDDGGTDNGGSDTSSPHEFILHVTPVNDIPTLVPPGLDDQVILVGGSVTLPLLSNFNDLDGDTLAYSVTVNTAASKASAVISGTDLIISGLSSGVTEITIVAVDGAPGSSPAVDTFEVAVGTLEPTATMPSTPPGGFQVSPQTGLFDITIPVENTTSFAINGFRLYVDYRAYLAGFPSLRLYNSTSGAASNPAYIDFPYPVAVGDTVNVRLSFYTSTRTFPNPFVPILTVEKLATFVTGSPLPGGLDFVAATIRQNTTGEILLEWPSSIGRWYRIYYSEDLTNWISSATPILAGTNQTQWRDSGAPFTQKTPGSIRFYMVTEIPASLVEPSNSNILIP
ncbi:Ig-like domain-containing protein [Rubritalea sp.]|uniref:Ig-like domain-containing protein n=1 Tax=Rubritalea sp. TaxID=2109375 RepID=UPI003EF5F69A